MEHWGCGNELHFPPVHCTARSWDTRGCNIRFVRQLSSPTMYLQEFRADPFPISAALYVFVIPTQPNRPGGSWRSCARKTRFVEVTR
jgi:hypothetical protein